MLTIDKQQQEAAAAEQQQQHLGAQLDKLQRCSSCAQVQKLMIELQSHRERLISRAQVALDGPVLLARASK